MFSISIFDLIIDEGATSSSKKGKEKKEEERTKEAQGARGLLRPATSAITVRGRGSVASDDTRLTSGRSFPLLSVSIGRVGQPRS